MNTFRSYFRSVLVGILLGLFLAGIFAIGFFFRDFLDLQRAPTVVSSSFPLLNEVQGVLDTLFLREQPSAVEREYGAIRGVLQTLGDKNTFFIDPPVAQSESDVLAGTYGGIGVAIKRNEQGEIELYPFDDSPALKAGIVSGSVLLAVNGVNIALEDKQDAIDQSLRGEVKSGNGVELELRLPTGESEKVFVEFAVINIPSVTWRVLNEDSRFGYIQIVRFTNRTPAELVNGIVALREQSVQALILDLRNNGGGLLQESISVASEFLDGGVVAYEVSRTDEKVYESATNGHALDLPLVILVNNYTASASELFAGAIRDRQRGLLIGQTTFGKGTVQQIVPLSDGSSIHVTFAEWLPPSKISLDGVGITPDITMIPDPNGRDVELGEAIRYLQSEIK